MKFVLIHGEDIKKSFARFADVKAKTRAKGYEIIHIEPSADISALSGNSLFADKILFVFDNFKKFKPTFVKDLVKNFKDADVNILAFWEGDANKTILTPLGRDIKVEKFDLPKELFNFLEGFYPKNAKNIWDKLQVVLQSEAPELVTFLLARHVRDLYWFKIDAENFSKLPSWRVQKIKNQAGKFTHEQLENMIKAMAEHDLKIKRSQMETADSLDLLIAKYL